MKNIQTFSLKRIVLLMQKTAFENAKFVIIGLSVIFSVFSVILIMNAFNDGQAWADLRSFYVFGFVVSGLIVTGMAFTNLRTKEKTISYLTLPASIIEKLISEILMTTVVFALLYTVIFYIFNLVVFLFGVSFNIETEIIPLFDLKLVEGFLYYVILQSVFLAGAATFRKAPLFFTSFVLFLVGIIIVIIVTAISVSILPAPKTMNINLGPNDFEEHRFLFVEIPKFIFYYLTAPVFWVVTYLKLKEKEV